MYNAGLEATVLSVRCCGGKRLVLVFVISVLSPADNWRTEVFAFAGQFCFSSEGLSDGRAGILAEVSPPADLPSLGEF